MATEEWREANRANWDERVAIHLKAYHLEPLRAGKGRLGPIVEAELGDVAGQRVLHLQCHFGADTLALAQRGAEIVGLDFSGEAIRAARALASELGLSERARFVQADLYDAPAAIPEPHGFDIVFVTWGTICWLPDIRRWAKVVAHFLKPGGRLYFAEGHPVAWVFDDAVKLPGGMPGVFLPYFQREALVEDNPFDYADPAARLVNTRLHQFMHPLGDIVTALIDAGLTLDWLHEHDAVPWKMFERMVIGEDRMYRWPDKPWLPLAFSLRATRRAASADAP